MSSLPVIEVFLRADPLEAVVVSDPPVNVEQPIFQSVNLDGVLMDDDIGVTIQPYDADYSDIKAKVESINTEDFATADQGSLAETSVQPDDLLPYALSSDVNIALGDKVDKITGKGLSTEDYTSAEKTKLLGIEEGAQVNPDLSVYAPTNNATFTGSLILPNNSRIAGVEHLYQATVPLTRGDGSPLQEGDIWYQSDSQKQWFRKGIYWVGEQHSLGRDDMAFDLNNGPSGSPPIPFSSFFIDKVIISAKLGVFDAYSLSSDSLIQLFINHSGNAGGFANGISISSILSIYGLGFASSASHTVEVPIGIFLFNTVRRSLTSIRTSTVGSPPASFRCSISILFRQAYND